MTDKKATWVNGQAEVLSHLQVRCRRCRKVVPGTKERYKGNITYHAEGHMCTRQPGERNYIVAGSALPAEPDIIPPLTPDETAAILASCEQLCATIHEGVQEDIPVRTAVADYKRPDGTLLTVILQASR